MLKYKLLFLVSVLFFSCAKDNTGIKDSITINYAIGDQQKIEYYRIYFFDDTTSTNRDTTFIQFDTVSTIIEKDTVINSKKCLVVVSKSERGSDRKGYIVITDSSINYFAYLFVQNNEIILHSEPTVAYKKILRLGTNWDVNNGIPNKMIVSGFNSITVNNKNYFCAKIEYKNKQKVESNPIANYEEYVDEKGLVLYKYDFERSGLIMGDGTAGYITGQCRVSRIK